jgi:predicted ATPase/DNA-binding CsgD family transcriptional regulator
MSLVQPDSLAPHAARLAPSVAAYPGAPLPLSLTSFIAREQECRALIALLRDPAVRLLTLTGPGGVGKTRLAVAAASDVQEDFPDGVAFINLTPITNPDLVLETISSALGLRDMGTDSLRDRLQTLLASKHLLLVLDNFEQVIESGPQVRGLLETSPNLTILVTSRTRLRVSGEREFPVAPMLVEESLSSGAVQLFVERARQVQPEFAPGDEAVPLIAELVRRVDGLPLAIELAAARLRALPLVTLLERLDQRLPLLSGAPRDLPLRQQTMRDTIAWSYDLLAPAEQQLFRRLAVFVGGFTLEAAEALVAGATPAASSGTSASYPGVIDGVTALIDHSLLHRAPDPAREPRYQMLETVREFGLERLATSGEAEEHAVRAAHAAYMLSLTAPVHDWPFAPSYVSSMTRLDAELDNMRSALGWADRRGDAALGLRLAGGMGYYWMMRGQFREGRFWLERMLRRPETAGTAPAGARARALNLAGALAAFQGDGDSAATLLAEAIRLARANEDWLRAGMALAALGLAELHRGDYRLASTRTEEAITILLRMEATTGETQVALSRAYANLGRSAFAQGDLGGAATALEEALVRARALGFIWGLGDTLRSLGDLARDQDNMVQARAYYRESVEVAREHGDPNFLAMALAGIAAIAAVQGRSHTAVRLFAAAAALRDKIGVPVEAWQQATYERSLEQARSALAPDAFAQLWAEGYAQELEEILTVALFEAAPPVDSSPHAGNPAGLTPRETDVLRLLAEGLSDREIAERLFLSPRTVGWHVTHVLEKLDTPTRTAAAAAAIRLGLL